MYSIVIATCNRFDYLIQTIECIFKQTLLPEKLIIIDSSDNECSNELEHLINEGKIIYKKVSYKSSAKQRNEGAALVNSKYIIFLDDDVSFLDDFFYKIMDAVTTNSFKVAAPRQEGAYSSPPGKLLSFYYRLQSGYNDETYGGKLFGCGLNCYPCYELQREKFIKSEWLPSTCLVIETTIFNEVKFPSFEGYSYGEDIYLTGLLNKSYNLFWLSEISYIHYSPSNKFKKNKRLMRRMAFENQKLIAKNVLGINPVELFMKQMLHRLFLFFIDIIK